MSISLTPDQIRELARQINEAISGLTNIEDILEATRADLARARDLERRANAAKSVTTLSSVFSFISHRDSVLCPFENCVILQGIRNTSLVR